MIFIVTPSAKIAGLLLGRVSFYEGLRLNCFNLLRTASLDDKSLVQIELKQEREFFYRYIDRMS